MYLRKLWLIIVLIGAMVSPLSFGLGLGEITLNSNLNEPLDAEIKLLRVRDLTAQEMFVQLGSSEDFRRRGIDRIFFLQDLRFDVQLSSANGPIIKVTSQKPVVEPFLIFIVQLESQSSGTSQREYTLLMDLPVFTDRPVQPVQPVQPQTEQPLTDQLPPAQIQPGQVLPGQAEAQAGTRPPVQQPTPPPAATPPPLLPTRPDTPTPARQQPQPVRQPPAEPLSPSLLTGENYEVIANDTLWEIALRTRPNRGLSVQQTMLALQRLNPDAFINGNINLLKEGQVLRIPEQAEIQQLDQRAAVSEVAYQNTQWSGNPDGIVSGAELQGSRVRDTSAVDDDTPRGQLTLAAPSDTSRATGDRSGSGLSAGERDVLENDLAITLEQLDSSQRENAELSERVQELEQQITTMERLIEVSSEELRTLQLAAQQTADASTEPPADDTIGETIVEDTGDAVSEPSTEIPAAAVQPPPVAPPVIPAPPKPSTVEMIVDMLMEYIWYVGIAVIFILLGAFYMWNRKTQAEMESFDDFDQEPFDDQSDLRFVDDDFEEETLAEDDFDIGIDDEELAKEVPQQPLAPTEAETGDAVSEADIYIAYGKYDQAEEMLRRAIVSEPDNVEARVKLLEVYSETSDIGKFDAEYGQLLALGDVSANQRAAELRGNIPGAGQYQQSAHTPADSQLEAPPTESSAAQVEEDGLDFNFDLDSNDFGSSDEATSNRDLDFDSADSGGGLDLGNTELETSSAPSGDEAKDEFDSIDFNLDLDDDGAELALDSEEEELSLDLDGSDTSDNNRTLSTNANDDGLSLDLQEDGDLSFDLDADEAEFDKEFDSIVDEPALANASVNDTFSGDGDAGEASSTEGDDILSDLEFSAALSSEDGSDDEAFVDNASPDLAGLGASSDDNDFDLSMGDIDLAALDKEMDALVGDIDDIDDGELAASPTEVVPALTEDDLSAEFNFSSTPVPGVEDDDGGLDEDSELDFLADTDEVATKLDLARAYIDMGDQDGAKDILSEVASEGNDEQKRDAQELLNKIK